MHHSLIEKTRLALVLAPLLLLAQCHERGHERAKDPPPSAVESARSAIATAVSWPEIVRVPGTVSALDRAVLASRTGGWVTAVNAEAGERVAKGELLVSVDLPAAESRVAEAEARVRAATAALAEASANRRRYGSLVRTHATSAQEYDSFERAFVTAEATLTAARSALTAARSDLTYAEIRAPFAGTITTREARLGAFAAPGAPLLTIAGATPEIRTHVGPETFRALRMGEAAEVVIDGAAEPARITRLVGAADPETRTHLVELRLEANRSAPFGAYAELRFTLGHTRQLAVPEAALTERAGLSGVFVLDREHRAHFRLVRTGARSRGRVAIVAGLAPGESIVLAPSPALRNDTIVRPEGGLSASLGPEEPHG